MTTDTSLERPTDSEHTRNSEHFRPDVDIVELADELIVLADVPGARSEDIDVNFEDGALTIYARVGQRAPSGPVLLREYGIGDYRRTFQVSEQIDASGISAQYREGVLTLRLPKAERARPRKIQVQG